MWFLLLGTWKHKYKDSMGMGGNFNSQNEMVSELFFNSEYFKNDQNYVAI